MSKKLTVTDLHGRLEKLCENVASINESISWLKKGVVGIYGALILGIAANIISAMTR